MKGFCLMLILPVLGDVDGRRTLRAYRHSGHDRPGSKSAPQRFQFLQFLQH